MTAAIPYVWTLDQIAKVSSVRASVLVDPVVLHLADADPDTLAAAIRGKLAAQIIDTCHAFAVEVNAADVVLHREDPPLYRWQPVRFTAAWAPTTEAVQLWNGPAEGHVYVVPGAPRTHVTVPVAIPGTARLTDETGPDVMQVEKVTYQLSGWRETARHWVYGVTP